MSILNKRKSWKFLLFIRLLVTNYYIVRILIESNYLTLIYKKYLKMNFLHYLIYIIRTLFVMQHGTTNSIEQSHDPHLYNSLSLCSKYILYFKKIIPFHNPIRIMKETLRILFHKICSNDTSVDKGKPESYRETDASPTFASLNS